MVDPHCEITMTAGATQIIFTALSSVGHPADEVIVLTPAHNGYEPKIILAGSRVFHIPLNLETAVEPMELSAKVALAWVCWDLRHSPYG